jgi:hypothetical protein
VRWERMEDDAPALMILARIAGPSEENEGPGGSSRMAEAYWGGSASAEPGFPVQQFAGDLQVAGVGGGLLDHVQDDPADVRDLLGVLRVLVKAEPARGRGPRRIAGTRRGSRR